MAVFPARPNHPPGCPVLTRMLCSFRRWHAALIGGLLPLLLMAGGCAQRAADGRIHITYWEKWSGFEAEAMRAVVDAFNRSQDRIVVDALSVSQIDRKTLIATAGGDPPDVAGLWVQNVASYADAAALTPLDEFIQRDGFTPAQWLARYYPVFADMCQYDGHVYAGISTPATIALFWNKTLFREAGLDPERPPRTVEELDDYSRRLTRRDPKTGALLQVGFLPNEPGFWPWIFCRWFGGTLYEQGKITLSTDPRNIAAMRWVAHFTQENGAEALITFESGFNGQFASPQAAFFTGKVALILQGVWYNNYIRLYKPGLDYGVGPWPAAVPGVHDFTMAEADVLVIPRGARHPQAAWEFIKYVNTCAPHARSRAELQGMELLCYLQQKLSPLQEWSPYFEQHHPNPAIKVFRELAASPHATHIPTMGIWQSYFIEVNAAYDRVRLLQATPEEALARAQQRISDAWARHLLSLQRHGEPPPRVSSLPP